jgi:putative glycosyltransferase (TIGR04372 family)
MTLPALDMSLAASDAMPADPVRKSRWLMRRAERADDVATIVAAARELRATGRADLALRALALPRMDPAEPAVRRERALALEAHGHDAQALQELRALAASGLADLDTDAAALRIAGQEPDGFAHFDFGPAASRIHSADDLARLLKPLLKPMRLGQVPLRGAWPVLRAAFRLGGPGIRTAAKWAVARTKVLISRVVASVAFTAARILTGRRHIVVTSMGKFTRLADLVDRIDPLLREIQARGEAARTRVFILFYGGYPNAQLFEMYRRHAVLLRMTTRVPRKLAMTFAELLRHANRHTEITVDYRKINRSFQANPPVLSFTDAEERTLTRGLEELGLDPARPLIVFGLRDMAYYQFYGDVMKIPLAKQGRRIQTHHRCPPLASYVGFARHWAERGYQVVRMGLRVSEVLPPDLHPLILDYASGPRSDALDAYLFAKCEFMVAGDTGLFSGAAAFDRPSVLSDLHLIQNTMYSSSKVTPNIFVPKLIRDVRENRILTLREQVHFNHFFSYYEDCVEHGFEIVHNTPEDIIEASQELAARLRGEFVAAPEDEERQRAFHSYYPPRYVGYGSTARVSAAFLRKHADLLD